MTCLIWRMRVRDWRDSVRIGIEELFEVKIVIWCSFDSIKNVAGLPDDRVGWIR